MTKILRLYKVHHPLPLQAIMENVTKRARISRKLFLIGWNRLKTVSATSNVISEPAEYYNEHVYQIPNSTNYIVALSYIIYIWTTWFHDLKGGAGRKTILLIFQPSHFIVLLLWSVWKNMEKKSQIFFFPRLVSMEMAAIFDFRALTKVHLTSKPLLQMQWKFAHT